MTRPSTPHEAAGIRATPSDSTSFGRYGTPESLASDAHLSVSVRIQLLRKWAQDLTDRLQASDENMPGDAPGLAGDLLRRVHVCLEKLEPPAPQH